MAIKLRIASDDGQRGKQGQSGAGPAAGSMSRLSSEHTRADALFKVQISAVSKGQGSMVDVMNAAPSMCGSSCKAHGTVSLKLM